MGERNQRANDPWTQLGEELGEALLQSFRDEMRKNVSGDTLDKIFDPDNDYVAVETLAAHCHDESWSGWLKYMFSQCHFDESGDVVIPFEAFRRWSWQMNTPYSELPEDMKESDREEARAILKLLEGDM